MLTSLLVTGSPMFVRRGARGGQWKNVQAMALKTETSASLPILNKLPYVLGTDPDDDDDDDAAVTPPPALKAKKTAPAAAAATPPPALKAKKAAPAAAAAVATAPAAATKG